MRRAQGISAVLVSAALLLATACGPGENSGAGSGFTGPDDMSSLWTALQKDIVVDYPNEPTVSALTAKADLVVRGRVVDVGRATASEDLHNALITVAVERVLSDPDGRAPDEIIVSIPVNMDNDVQRIDDEAPKPAGVIFAVSRLGAPMTDGRGGVVDKSGVGPPVYGMITNDAIIDFEAGASYTPFNDFGETPEQDDPFRGNSLSELEAAFVDAATS